MREQLYVLSTLAEGAGKLTAACRALLDNHTCPRCRAWTPDLPLRPVDIELEWRPDDVPLNFVAALMLGVVRQDLLSALGKHTDGNLLVGKVKVKGSGVLHEFATFRGCHPLRIRGDHRSTRDACDECGRFKSFAYHDQEYVLTRDLDGRTVYQANGSRLVIVERLRPLFEPVSRWEKLTIEPLREVACPEDGLPPEFPRTWDEFEEAVGGPVELPKRLWTGRLDQPVGRWARERIAQRGMDWFFKRPDPRDIAIKLELEGESVRCALEQWPAVRDEVLLYYDQHRAEIKSAVADDRLQLP